MKKKYLITIVCIFLAFLIVPSVASIAKGQSDYSEKENRALSTRPDFSFSDLMDGYLQTDYENYLSDQFVLRDKLVTAKTTAFKLLGKKDINNIYMGSDGYLIEKYIPTDFDEDSVELNIETLTDFLNENASNYNTVSCVLVPSKGAVLSNKMPSGATAYSTDYVAEEIENSLNKNVKFLYLKNALQQHNNEYIYYKSDHHWTSLGAYYGYQQYKNLIGETAPALSSYSTKNVTNAFLGTDYDKLQTNSAVDTITQFALKNQATVSVNYNGESDNSKSLYVKSCLNEKDKYAYFLGGNFSKINIKTSVNNGKKLLLVKDSFSNSMLPFLVNDYSEIVVVDLRYYDDTIYTIINEEQGITDVLVMYNTEKFMNDTNQWRLDNIDYYSDDDEDF